MLDNNKILDSNILDNDTLENHITYGHDAIRITLLTQSGRGIFKRLGIDRTIEIEDLFKVVFTLN